MIYEKIKDLGVPTARLIKDFGTHVTKFDSPRGESFEPWYAPRPPQLCTKPCSVTATTHGLTVLSRNAQLPPSRADILIGFGLCPAAYHRLKIITSPWLRFPDFQRRPSNRKWRYRKHHSVRSQFTYQGACDLLEEESAEAIKLLRSYFKAGC